MSSAAKPTLRRDMSPLDPSRSASVGVGAEPAYCPSCDLRHMRRPDWLCPRCGMPVESEANPLPRKRARAAPPEYVPEFPLGSFVAGAVLAVTGLVLAIGFARHPVTEHRWPLVAAMALLALLGLELLLKVSPARPVAIAIALLAAVLALEDLVRARAPDLMRDPLPPAARALLRDVIRALYPMNILLASGLLAGSLLLVVGRPGRARIAAGALLATPLAVVEIVRAFAP
jgi:hypothetical protein